MRRRTPIGLALLLALLVSACGGSDQPSTGMAMTETDSTATTPTSATEAAPAEDGAADEAAPAEDGESDETGADEPEATGSGPAVEILEPDGSAPVERSGNMVRATVSGWEDQTVPIWLVIVTPGDQQYPFPAYVAEDGTVAWSELFIGSEAEDGEDFSLVVAAVEDGTIGAAEIERLVAEGGGAVGLVAMPGIEELARQDIVRSTSG